MIEAHSCRRLIAELGTKRVNTVRSRQCMRNTRSFSTATRRLATPSAGPGPGPAPAEHTPSARDLQKYVAKIGRSSSLLRNATEPYAAFGGTEQLFKVISKQASYTIPNREKKTPEPGPKNEAGEDIGVGEGVWFAPRRQGGLELPVTFLSWAQVMFLHLYILTVRLRRFPADHVRIWEQHLIDHFSYAAEERMEKYHGMAARGVRNKNLRDLFLQWRGVTLSYDEGLIKGDAMMGAAVWRAIFKGSLDARIDDVAWVTAYLRQELQRLDTRTNDQIAAGDIEFGDLRTAKKTLAGAVPGSEVPFSAADTQEWQKLLEEPQDRKR